MLYKDLLDAGTIASGTLCSSRKNFSKSLKQKFKSVPRGTTTFAFHDNITTVKWCDNCDVYAIASLYSNSTIRVKHQVDVNTKEIPCLEIIEDYNTFMYG